MDVGDETVRAVKSTRGNCELAIVVPESDANLPTEVLLSMMFVEDIPLPEVVIEVGGLSKATDVVLRNEPSSSVPVDVPSSAEGRK